VSLSVVVIANVINGFGALCSFWATYLIGFSENDKQMFKYAAGSAAFLMVGSALLGSWPAVFLDAVWVILSLLGVKGWSLPHFARKFPLLLFPMGAVGLFALTQANYTLAAFMCAGIYIVGFTSFTAGLLTKRSYLLWCVLGFGFFIPHLLDFKSYAILVMESVSCLLGLAGIYKITAGKKPAVKTPSEPTF
jgi:hypothetical protein